MKRILLGVGVAGVAGLAAGLARRSLLLVTVDGPSMLPTLEPGEPILVVRRAGRRVRRGQIVVFRRPAVDAERPVAAPPGPASATSAAAVTTLCVKRVAATAGDPVPPGLRSAVGGDSVVPPGRILVLGDNPGFSRDSRAWGYISAHDVLGVRALSGAETRQVLSGL